MKTKTTRPRRIAPPAGHVFTLEPLRAGPAAIAPAAGTLTEAEVKALSTICIFGGGAADVVSPALARTLRDLDARRPGLVTLTDVPPDATGMKPYFGVVVTAAGRAALDAFSKGGA